MVYEDFEDSGVVQLRQFHKQRRQGYHAHSHRPYDGYFQLDLAFAGVDIVCVCLRLLH